MKYDVTPIFVYFVGLENRPKDVGKFFFWMTVRGKDLEFLVANLSEEESAHEMEECQVKSATESTYARRKRRLEDSSNQQKLSDQSQQMAMFKEIMSTPDRSATPQSSDSIDSVNNSVGLPTPKDPFLFPPEIGTFSIKRATLIFSARESSLS